MPMEAHRGEEGSIPVFGVGTPFLRAGHGTGHQQMVTAAILVTSQKTVTRARVTIENVPRDELPTKEHPDTSTEPSRCSFA